MHRVVAPQPGEIRLPDIVAVEQRIADVDCFQWCGRCMGVVIEANWSVHLPSP
jgi:hypothetical protein